MAESVTDAAPVEERQTGVVGPLKHWIAGVGLILLAGIGVGVSTGVIEMSIIETLGRVIVGLIVAIPTVGFLLWGTYQSSKSPEVDDALAIALSVWVLGSILVAAIVYQLVA